MAEPKKKILVLEDENMIRHLLRDLLSDQYLIMEGEDGFNVGNVLFSFSPDLIILDLKMPITDGHTVLENIQKFYVDKDKEPPKILVVSSFVNAATKSNFKGLPVSDCLAKPFSIDDLRARIDSLLA